MAFWASAGRGPKPYRPVRRNSKARPVTQVLTENPADRIQFDRRGEKSPSHMANPANKSATTSAAHQTYRAIHWTGVGRGQNWVFGKIGIATALEDIEPTRTQREGLPI